MNIDKVKIAVIEQGYVGLTLAKEFGLEVDVYDYEADQAEVKQEYGINLIDEIKEKYDGILLPFAHNKFSMIDIQSLKKGSESVVFDLKGFFTRNQVDSRL